MSPWITCRPPPHTRARQRARLSTPPAVSRYGPPLHAAREFGCRNKLFDLLDETRLLPSPPSPPLSSPPLSSPPLTSSSLLLLSPPLSSSAGQGSRRADPRMRPAARARGGPGGLPRRADSRAGRGAGCLPPDQGVRPAMVQRAEVRKDAQGRRGGVRPLLTRCSPRVPGREQTSRRCRPFLGPAAGLSALRGGPRWVRRRGTCGFIFA